MKQIKMMKCATLKSLQDYWKWYEYVKVSMCYHNKKFDIYYINSVWEICDIKGFAMLDSYKMAHP